MDKKEKVLKKDENPYDPLEIAQREGKVFGLGLKGNYKRTKITVFGFILLGGIIFLTGILFIFQTFSVYLSSEKSATTFVSQYVLFLIGIGVTLLGGMIIFRVIKKK